MGGESLPMVGVYPGSHDQPQRPSGRRYTDPGRRATGGGNPTQAQDCPTAQWPSIGRSTASSDTAMERNAGGIR